MPRFVILRHDFPAGHARALHWDLLLEADGSLRTWALASEPRVPGESDAEQLADHRLLYLDYEGPVSGDRGEVSRFDAGVYAIDFESSNRLQVTLRGQHIHGLATLERAAPDSHSWRVSLLPLPGSP